MEGKIRGTAGKGLGHQKAEGQLERDLAIRKPARNS
jgi:hypothetical protein